MDSIIVPERETQNRVVALLQKLGYEYLDDWSHREQNNNIEEEFLLASLKKRGYSAEHAKHAADKLRHAADSSAVLYDVNKEVYELLRYGAAVRVAASENTETVHFIDWQNPHKNDFAVAEEVTLRGTNERRPDIVLYVNGIALAVLELKRSSVSVQNGIRQNISNCRPEFNARFFSTVQFLFAGNDSEGLRYGGIGAPDRHFLRWKEEGANAAPRNLLDAHLSQMCAKERFLELIYDFVLFDGGIKKLPRPHQYFAVKAAQKCARKYEGGIVWHTQGSGKSLVMVLLARWILENMAAARILILVDRTELEAQIRDVFADMHNAPSLVRAESGDDLRDKLRTPEPRILAALVHKFGQRHLADFEQQMEELSKNSLQTAGELFVFVDECHRTNSGKLHRAMKAMLPDAVFIGFTGTPLLKKEKEYRVTSAEVFGSYIHTYKYNEAVADGVALDLVYEARDIEQKLSSPQKVDEWFAAKTAGLNEWQKNALQKKWATMRSVLSAQDRMRKIASDVLLDFSQKPRLVSERGTAMLVATTIYEACKYYRIFAEKELRGKCAVITSHNPHIGDISGEDTGAETDTDRKLIYDTYMQMFTDLHVANAEECEQQAKERFIKEPARMRLLIVVDKLLTGFDAPSCSVLYIDKNMQDHGLFQAICRANRLDGDDKNHGFIVDYKNLFVQVQDAFAVYTAALAESEDGGDDPQIRIQVRLQKCRARLEEAREKIAIILEPAGRGEDEMRRYFCGNPEDSDALEQTHPKRGELYKAAAALLRAFADIADDMPAAGYSAKESAVVKKEVDNTANTRQMIRLAAGEWLDTKSYEPDMRHLIDSYINAEESRVISEFRDLSVLDLVKQFCDKNAAARPPECLRKTEKGTAETIANNLRAVIKEERMNSPEFYERMSAQLTEILRLLREEQIDYAEFLNRITEIERHLRAGHDDSAPKTLQTSGQRALYECFNTRQGSDAEELALRVDEKIKHNRPADWRGNQMKERMMKGIIADAIGGADDSGVGEVLDIVRRQKEYE